MKISFIAIAVIYYLSWFLSDKKRNNVMYHGGTIPRQLKLVLNPFKDNNEFELSSVILEVYAHISLLIIFSSLIFGGTEFLNYKAWLVFSFTLFCIVGVLNFIFDTPKRKSILNKVINILLIIILVMSAIASLLLAFSIIYAGN